MRLGISLKIDVTKIDKSRIFVGAKGKYLDLTTFIDTENVSRFGDNGAVSQTLTTQERSEGVKTSILGNAKIFYTDGGRNVQQPARTNDQSPPDNDSFDIPF